MRKAFHFFFFLIFFSQFSFAQISPSIPSGVRIIEILEGDNLGSTQLDSLTQIETISGKVVLREGTILFTCDRAIINRRYNTMEAFGNVRINQGDSVFTSSDYIKYLGNERIAYLKKNVRLTDKRSTLTTQELEYNLATSIAKYNNGGRLVNEKTVLTSKQGVYYEDTKDVYFINNVKVVDPKTNIKADSLLYNTQTQNLIFIGPTDIKNKDGNIFTTQGSYDLKAGNAFFGNRTLFKDSSGRSYVANTTVIDDKLGQVQMEGNAIINDSANNLIVIGNQIYLNKKNNSFLATVKPVLIIWQDKDTTYITGDTLFSGFTKKVNGDNIIPKRDSVTNDSISLVTDTIRVKGKNMVRTVKGNQEISDTSIRYFLAYHNVKIFNDSLQAVCDSLFYSGADSVFRLFYDPVIWSGKNQVTGDTIFLYTKNKKMERVYVFENGLMVNKINTEFYNQISGKTINGYFKDGVIDYMRVKGSPSESIYYVQDKDSAFTGMNNADGSVIDMFFKNQQLDKVKFINDVHGKLYPIRQIPNDKKFLKKFVWLDKRRPKNKLELFE